MKYLELTEVKERLEAEDIKYREGRINGGIFVYVNGLMQIDNPTKKQQKQFWPEVRISLHDGDYGYYVKACGAIHENQNIKSILGFIDQYVFLNN